ncbi:MAG: molybdenum cofactor guanylyltransferase [Planctomycetes bacterium]|nr:molybdenum cofactor guanylyltransferase [Planctomycetota bacterium]
MLLGAMVLTGGQSRRMGRPKESLPFRGNTLLGRAVEMLLLCAHPVLVVARESGQDLPPLPLEVAITFDSEPGSGPLAAIRDGMRFLGNECDAVFVCGCDMPFLTTGYVGWLANLLGDHDLVIPRLQGVLQPMAAIYRLGLLPRIETALRAGKRAPKELVDDCDARIVTDEELGTIDPRHRLLTSIDTPEEYQQALVDE